MITIGDTTTTSLDTFTVSDDHSIAGNINSQSESGLNSVGWTDSGNDNANMKASGTKGTSGDTYTFTEGETGSDNFSLGKTITGTLDGSAQISASFGSATTGSCAGSSFSYQYAPSTYGSLTEDGNLTYDGVTSTFATLNVHSLSTAYAVTGAPAVTTPLGTYSSTSTSGSDDGANLTETEYAGQGDTAGVDTAGQIGSSTRGSAEHLGTSPGSLDTSSGLMSALGGMGVHAMSFAGPDILPEANTAGTEVWLAESNEVGQTATNWVSHPSGIGYRRSSPGIITTTGSGSSASTSQGPPLPGNAPSMDTGLSDGGTTSELNRLSNFNAGGNENPTAMQPGPISRVEQVGCGGLSPLDSAVMNDQTPGIWTPYGNPLYYPENSASRMANHVDSSQSGQAARGYGGGLASVPVSAPADNRMLGPGGTPTPAPSPARQGYVDPEAPPGPGDLVIVTAGSPATEKPPDPNTVETGPQRGSTYAEFQLASKPNHFMLSPIQPKNQRELEKAINDAVAANGGKPFRRIFILSHAGGESESPSITMHSNAMFNGEPLMVNGEPVDVPVKVTGANIIGDLVLAIQNALEANGTLILGTCGYYWEVAGSGHRRAQGSKPD